MKLTLQYGLPFAEVTLAYKSQTIALENVLIDTGSAGTIFATEKVAQIGLILESNDMIHRVQGIGGSEFVFGKQVDKLVLGDLTATNFEIEVGALDYGFDLNDIIGMNFLKQVEATIDLAQLEVYSATG